jgi:hypothetical protein
MSWGGRWRAPALAACIATLGACYSPSYPSGLQCSDAETCPPGQGCDEVHGVCTDACADGACIPTLTVHTQQFEQLARSPLANVKLRVTSLPAGKMTPVVSGQDGAESVDGLAANTALELMLTFQQSDPVFDENTFATRFLGGNLGGPVSLDIPVVNYRWLAKTAFECGVGDPPFTSIDDATYDPGTTNPNGYFYTRSTILGEVFNMDGSPATLNRSMIHAIVDGVDNFDGDPSDTTNTPPVQVCFLEPDAASGTYVGTTADHTTSGRFVMFRVRDPSSVGAGFAEVKISGYPDGLVNLRSTGDIGVVEMMQGAPAPVLPPAQSFATDVYPLVQTHGCPTCHRPGKLGYDEAAVRGGVGADFSGTASQVYAVLMAGGQSACDNPATPERLCVTDPKASLFYTKPRLETGNEPSDHLGIAFPEDDPFIQTILQWITNGAQP